MTDSFPIYYKQIQMTKENGKEKLSFKECRKNLLNDLQARAGNKVVEKKVRFQNDDVPTFLGRLNKFEQKNQERQLLQQDIRLAQASV